MTAEVELDINGFVQEMMAGQKVEQQQKNLEKFYDEVLSRNQLMHCIFGHAYPGRSLIMFFGGFIMMIVY